MHTYIQLIAFVFCLTLMPAQSKELSCDKLSQPTSTDSAHYIEIIEKRIYRNWFPPKSSIPYRRNVLFRIDKTGHVLEAHIANANKPFSPIERASLNAIENSQPFPPPPGNKDVDIDFTFDYKVKPQFPEFLSLPKKIIAQWMDKCILNHDEQTNIAILIGFITLMFGRIILKNISSYAKAQENKEVLFTDLPNKQREHFENDILD